MGIGATIASAVLPVVAQKVFGDRSRGGPSSFYQERAAAVEHKNLLQRHKLASLLESLIMDLPARGGPAFKLPRTKGAGSNLDEVLASIDFGSQNKISKLMTLLGAVGQPSTSNISQLGNQAYLNQRDADSDAAAIAENLAFALLQGNYGKKNNSSRFVAAPFPTRSGE